MQQKRPFLCQENIFQPSAENQQKSNVQKEQNLSQTEKDILLAIKEGNICVDDIVTATGLKVFELMPTLTVLEIKGLIVKNGNGDYAVIKN